jgi:hypothetical protein
MVQGSPILTRESKFDTFFLFRHRVLKQNAGIEFGLGGIQWELAGCLLLSWLLVYVIICKGLHSSGKVILNLISTLN